MDDDRPSLASRAIAIAVMVVVALVAIRLLIGAIVGAISAVFWIVVLIGAIIAFFWARGTLRAASRDRQERKARKRETKAVAPRAPAATDPVEAQMAKIKQQLREQGRL